MENQEVEIKDPKAVLDALERAKADAKRYREEKEALEIDLNSKDQIIAEFSGKMLRNKVSERLNDMNISSKIMKFIDFSQIEFTDSEEVSGLDSQVETLRNDFPELFDPKVLVGGKADAADKKEIPAITSASQMQAMKILGKL